MATASGSAPGPRKPLIEVAGRSLLEHSLAAFGRVAEVVETIVVAHPEDCATLESWRADRPALARVTHIVAGGAERADSVRIGCTAASGNIDLLAVHDAARPLVSSDEIELAIRRAGEHGAAMLARPVADSLHASEDGETVARKVDRAGLWAAQTPQVFRAAELRAHLEQALAEGRTFTDEAALWEHHGGTVAVVPAGSQNLKVTTRHDLRLVEAWLALHGMEVGA